MQMHYRERTCRKARLEIHQAVLDISEKHGLTFVEEVQALTEVIQSSSKYALRHERHGTGALEGGLHYSLSEAPIGTLVETEEGVARKMTDLVKGGWALLLDDGASPMDCEPDDDCRVLYRPDEPDTDDEDEEDD